MHTDDDIIFVPYGVSDEFAVNSGFGFGYLTCGKAKKLILPRNERVHKGDCGHALLICGSTGMIGAAILATGAALRSGCGLVTTHIPAEERCAVSANYPSAMLSLDKCAYFAGLPTDLHKHNAIGVGCGLGTFTDTRKALKMLLEWGSGNHTKMVIDADALNILAANPEMLEYVPYNTIFTPHDGELERLIGHWKDEEHKIMLTADFARKHNIIVIMKGPNTLICTRGESFISNSNGNAGMAKGGSGDVLTGFIAGLLARGYDPEAAAQLGVYIHGLAGDKAADFYGLESMNGADIIDFLSEAYSELSE